MIRTRFAPSPTGSLHVGGARTALFNYLFAKKQNGIFILRIEDTDAARSTKESEQVILRDLKWLGIQWDEGPDIGGDFGPYRQSERLEKYQAALKKLQEMPGTVYPCFCSEEELEAKRRASLEKENTAYTPVYNCQCRDLPEKKVNKLKEERPSAWRFHVHISTQGITASGEKTPPLMYSPITVHDLIHGNVTFDRSLIGDFVLIKSNGLPSYNFACVVDDADMKITHVIRGDEHLTNTPRQILLYEALGIPAPQFAHLSMILAPDHTKLSKRHGTTAVQEFKEKGYLPHAIINYISLLGWSPKDDREIFTPEKEENTGNLSRLLLQELSNLFSMEGVSSNPAVFDQQKLTWMNAQYIKRLKSEDLLEAAAEISSEIRLKSDNKKIEKAYLSMIQSGKERFHTLLDIEKYFNEYFDSSKFVLEESAEEVLSWNWSLEVLKQFKKEIENTEVITDELIPDLIKNIQKATGRKGKELYFPIRVSLTGKIHGPELAQLIPLLGKEETLKRISKAKLQFAEHIEK
jgi:nondiscriminating glutamyl-tRNA synthetase